MNRFSQALRQFSALLGARNREFWRDRSALGWSLAFPAFVIIGLYFAFSDSDQKLYKVGLVVAQHETLDDLKARVALQDPDLDRFLTLRHVEFLPVTDLAAASHKVARHQLDLVIDSSTLPVRYWVNTDSQKGYVLERLLVAGAPDPQRALQASTLRGEEARYVDWVIPGVIGMNMMFGCLWGVGYVIVRYRSNGVLRRFRATPVSAFTFLSAQVVSRLLIALAITSLIFFPSWWLLQFRVEGSLLSLLVVTVFGALALIALGLVTATRTASIEVSGGILNLLTWPMMLLSGVWFSLEGADPWLQYLADLLPLTHFVDAARAIMIDGATLPSLWPQLAALAAMTVLFMAISAATFRWER